MKGAEVKSESRSFFRLCVWIIVVLAIPILPFVGFGDAMEQRFTGWIEAAISPGTVVMLVVGSLTADIFLPVPSSFVIAFSGRMLGFWGGMAVSWCGMTLGAVAAFGLVRAFGRPMAQRFATMNELNRVDAMAARVGILVLVLTRPVPILAEAAVLLMGTTLLSWRRFLVAVGLSNLGIAAAYAALGDSAKWPVALLASIALPLLAGGIARLLWPENGQRASVTGPKSEDIRERNDPSPQVPPTETDGD
jgi:uncharacterized membrane protein YdjX (TVP38/TMEM64 family)